MRGFEKMHPSILILGTCILQGLAQILCVYNAIQIDINMKISCMYSIAAYCLELFTLSRGFNKSRQQVKFAVYVKQIDLNLPRTFAEVNNIDRTSISCLLCSFCRVLKNLLKPLLSV